MKKTLLKLAATAATIMASMPLLAQAPEKCDRVMLQGFYWDSYSTGKYSRTKWDDLKKDTTEIAEVFDMIWLPPSARSTGGNGYHPTVWSNQSSDWGKAESLLELIAALKRHDCYAIADVVINHRGNKSSWIDFEKDDFGRFGGEFQFDASHICSNDEAAKNGQNPTGAKDAGYDNVTCEGVSVSGAYCAARDLDHSSPYVQDAVKAYLTFLKDSMGYMGWRYDLVKGYLGKYTKMYNDAAGAYFSVGEYWDGNTSNVNNWLKDTEYSSTAFDFPMKYSAFNNALSSDKYTSMVAGGKQVGLENKRYACTFVDNHDTFRDGNKYSGSIPKAYAYLLSAPGIPCVFFPHWEMYKKEINNMISVRKACGIHSESASTASAVSTTTTKYYTCTTEGTNGTLICFIGSGWEEPVGYTLATSGNGWAYYISNGCTTPYVSIDTKPGYAEKVEISTLGGDKIYYTLDGSEPTSESTLYSGPIAITEENVTVKCIAINSSDKKSQTRTAEYTNVKPDPITVKVLTSDQNLGTSNIKIYAWNNDGYELSSWANSPNMGKVEIDGTLHWEYTFPQEIQNVNIIIRGGSKQTVNYEDITTTTCFKVGGKNESETSKYNLTKVRCAMVNIDETEAIELNIYPNPTYDVFNIACNENVEKVTIRNLGAQIVMVKQNSRNVDIQTLENGIYFAEINLSNGSTVIRKIIKK